MDKVITKIDCNCGWHKWNTYPLETSDEEILELDQAEFKDHLLKVHGFTGETKAVHAEMPKQ